MRAINRAARYGADMLAAPTGLTDEALVAVLARSWGIEVAGLEYRAVGFGSHHWEVVEAGGARWFVTVDELGKRRIRPQETNAQVQERLAASLGAARALRNLSARYDFVVAPIPSLDGSIVLEVAEEFCTAVYPIVEGESFAWGEERDPDQTSAILAMLIDTHDAPGGLNLGAPQDDFAIQMRGVLEQALADGVNTVDRGPYSVPLAKLLRENEEPLRSSLRKYDELVSSATARTTATTTTPAGADTRRVLTHGEPHPGNTMLAPEGWKLIDWDTAAFAPPERDLWFLDPGDHSVFQAYSEETGYAPSADLLELYRLRWDLTDLALFAAEFRGEHIEDPNTAKGWTAAQGVARSIADTAAGSP